MYLFEHRIPAYNVQQRKLVGFVFGKSAVLWSTCTRVLAEFKTCGLARGTSVRLIYQRELCDYLKKKKNSSDLYTGLWDVFEASWTYMAFM